jgi:hypothetical protein
VKSLCPGAEDKEVETATAVARDEVAGEDLFAASATTKTTAANIYSQIATKKHSSWANTMIATEMA